MGHLRKTSNYLERIILSNQAHTMSMSNLVSIGVETPMLDRGCYLKKEFIE